MCKNFDDSEFKNDLQKRLFNFSVKTILLVRLLPKGKEYDVIIYQVFKSSSSCGANYEESQGAVSGPDFSNKVSIALKEIRESNYWIRIIIAVTEKNSDWIKLRNESHELMKILGSIYAKTSAKSIFHS
jgi:four helix bundle protein